MFQLEWFRSRQNNTNPIIQWTKKLKKKLEKNVKKSFKKPSKNFENSNSINTPKSKTGETNKSKIRKILQNKIYLKKVNIQKKLERCFQKNTNQQTLSITPNTRGIKQSVAQHVTYNSSKGGP